MFFKRLMMVEVRRRKLRYSDDVYPPVVFTGEEYIRPGDYSRTKVPVTLEAYTELESKCLTLLEEVKNILGKQPFPVKEEILNAYNKIVDLLREEEKLFTEHHNAQLKRYITDQPYN